MPRSTFNWRIARMVQHGLLRKQSIPVVGQSIVYSVRRTAIEYLATRGECLADMHARGRRSEDAGLSAMFHSLGLNEIHLRMKQGGELAEWKWESQIRSQNELTTIPYAKDYDAIITVRLEQREVQFALEYERMAKSSSRYLEIRRLIEAERNVYQFLYLTAHYNLLNYVSQHFEYTPKRIYFGLIDDFAEGALGMRVLDNRRLHSASLREALRLGSQS